MTTSIYGLFCPIDGKLKYVGKSGNPVRRLKDHMLDVRDMPVEKLLWVDEMKRKKLKPILEILDEVSVDNWQYWENFYIEYFKSLGIQLLNKRSGNGLTFANSKTFKVGNRPHNLGKKKINGIYI